MRRTTQRHWATFMIVREAITSVFAVRGIAISITQTRELSVGLKTPAARRWPDRGSLISLVYLSPAHLPYLREFMSAFRCIRACVHRAMQIVISCNVSDSDISLIRNCTTFDEWSRRDSDHFSKVWRNVSKISSTISVETESKEQKQRKACKQFVKMPLVSSYWSYDQ